MAGVFENHRSPGSGPSRTFVFLDMREDSIDVGNFAPDMRGWPNDPSQWGFYDLPGAYHHRHCGFSFADGHSEIKRWLDDRTIPRGPRRLGERHVPLTTQPGRLLVAGTRDTPPPALAAKTGERPPRRQRIRTR